MWHESKPRRFSARREQGAESPRDRADRLAEWQRGWEDRGRTTCDPDGRFQMEGRPETAKLPDPPGAARRWTQAFRGTPESEAAPRRTGSTLCRPWPRSPLG